jgi:hypothetical protein
VKQAGEVLQRGGHQGVIGADAGRVDPQVERLTEFRNLLDAIYYCQHCNFIYARASKIGKNPLRRCKYTRNRRIKDRRWKNEAGNCGCQL